VVKLASCTSRLSRWGIVVRVSCFLFGLAALPVPVAAARSILTIPPATATAMHIVVIHNQVRAVAGIGPLYWDATLAVSADSYASELARTGRWRHSAPASRLGQGENLWMGTRGAFTVEQMIGAWTAEGRAFRPGRFPYVSRTGSWEHVGHFTQMIWPGTLRIGCALRSSARSDYFVCRYAPAGNVMGVTVP
jgi:hypothetical protein